MHRALIILSQLPVHQNSQYWLLTLADWCSPTALRWAVVALHLPTLINRLAQWLQLQPPCPHTMYGEIPIFFGFSDFFFSLIKPLFVRTYLEPCVHLQLPSRNRKNSEQACWWLVHKCRNTHAWGRRGVSLHVTWWCQQVGFQLVEITERHGVTHSVRSRRYQALAYLRESTITMRWLHSWIFLPFIVRYFHLPGTSVMWIFFFFALSDVKKLKCGV